MGKVINNFHNSKIIVNKAPELHRWNGNPLGHRDHRPEWEEIHDVREVEHHIENKLEHEAKKSDMIHHKIEDKIAAEERENQNIAHKIID